MRPGIKVTVTLIDYAGAMNEILSRAQLLIRRPAPHVYDAFVNPDVMTRFWFPRSSGRLEAGKSVRWYVTAGAEGPVIEVRVGDLDPGRRIEIEWGGDGEFTKVIWTFEPQSPASTFVRVVESGYGGSDDDVIARALDSTGGFHLVLAAAKAWLEHGVPLNIVRDHAPGS